ncbi:hypothetical protein PAXINDRAFT_19166 [Paxillus involutus ATCC 200175]|uniref:Uncharacterized protein n=1 Tax=Paxillus involutus ATCC 200175 TaxID=664439 RepID=A0A0C9SNC1_PAXIN|nr:hypothetical protein PAXINDRAFT_19166 [Paxillus involutus ATCC 200175]
MSLPFPGFNLPYWTLEQFWLVVTLMVTTLLLQGTNPGSGFTIMWGATTFVLVARSLSVDQLIHLYLKEDVHNHILIEPISIFNHVNDPLIREAPVTAHKIVLWPPLAGTWLEHPDHPQNLAGPTGLSDIYINETTVSVLEALNLPIVTKSYDNVHLSRCLVHHQGYEKSSIGLKYKIHYSLRTDKDDYDIHPFYYTNRLQDPNDHEDPPSPTYDVPTIQKWNEVMDADAHRRYWALRGGIELHERMAQRSEMLATAIAANASLPWNKKRKYAEMEEEVLDTIAQEGFYNKRVRREPEEANGVQVIPDTSSNNSKPTQDEGSSSNTAPALDARPIRNQKLALPRSSLPANYRS